MMLVLISLNPTASKEREGARDRVFISVFELLCVCVCVCVCVCGHVCISIIVCVCVCVYVSAC
jgi:hypothetical protein